MDSCVAYLLTHTHISYLVQGQKPPSHLVVTTLVMHFPSFSLHLRLTLFPVASPLAYLNMFSVDTNFEEAPYAGAVMFNLIEPPWGANVWIGHECVIRKVLVLHTGGKIICPWRERPPGVPLPWYGLGNMATCWAPFPERQAFHHVVELIL